MIEFVKETNLDEIWNKSVDDTSDIFQCLKLYTARVIDMYKERSVK